MKKLKRLSSVIIALAVCAMLVVTTWATNEVFVSYKGELDQPSITASAEAQTVTLTIKADNDITLSAFHAEVTVPDGLSIQSISSDQLTGEGKGVLIAEGGAMIWYAADAEDVTTQELAKVVINVPAGTAADDYEIGVQIIEMARNYGGSWDLGELKNTTLTIKCNHSDAEKLTTTYTNNGDDHIVTITCACGEVAERKNEAHADAAKDGNHECDDCKAVVEECFDAGNDGDHICDECTAEGVSVCGDSDPKNHICDTDSVCEVYKTGSNAHVDNSDPKDHVCDYGCSETIGEHADGDDEDIWCDYCGGEIVCEQCDLETISGQPATCTTAGWRDYFQCKACYKYYSDSEAKNVIDPDVWKTGDGAIGATNHEGEELKYTNNGDTHSAVYDPCGTTYVTGEDHDFTNGDCVCGAKEPVSNINVVSKGVNTYTVDGSVVTVTHTAACKVGYLENGAYKVITAVANADGSYSFTAPEGVTEVLLVVKGDVDLDGDVDIDDFIALARHIGEVEFITDPAAMFNADVDGKDAIGLNDFIKLAQYIGEVITEL